MDYLKSTINEKCDEQFKFVNEFEKVINESIIPRIKKYINNSDNNTDEKSLIHAITALTCEGIRTYKSSILLISEGYATNALINLRSLVDIVFTIDYILENKKLRYKRALAYLQGKKNESVWKKAERSLNKTLYEAYRILCEYTHMNYVATSKNILDGFISTSANDVLVEPTAIFVNGVFLYFLQITCEFYDIDYAEITKIEIPDNIKEQVSFYNAEKKGVDFLSQVLKVLGIKEVEIENYKQSYKEYKIKKSLQEKEKMKNKYTNKNKRKHKKQKTDRKRNKMK